MSLYDDAALALIAEGAAGKDDVLYNIKPEEKVKATELLTNGGFDTSDSWNITPNETHITITGGKLVITDAVANEYHRAKSAAALFEIGKTYRVSFEVSDFSRSGSTAKVFVLEDDNAGFITIDRNGQHSGTFTAAGYDHGSGLADTELVFKVVGGNTETVSCKIDNVSVKEVEQAPKDFTFTRGSNLTATRVGPDGLIEKGRENLLLQSNQFDTTWLPNNTSETGGQGGYDGSSNAWELKMTGTQSGTNEARVRQDGLSVSGVCTYSVYAKAGNVNWVRLLGVVTGSTNPWAYFDLSGDGAVGTTSSSVIDTSIESIGSGWFRVSVTYPGAANDLEDVRINIADADESPYVAQNSYIFIQNAQLEAGLVATPYIDSPGGTTSKAGILEDEPRFDYTGVTCPHLLMEPNRMNLVPQSEYLPDSQGTRVTATVNTSETLSPEGVYNAVKMMDEATGDANHTHVIETLETASSLDNSTVYTVSAFVKDNGRDAALNLSNSTGLSNRAAFNLSGSGSVIATGSFDSASIEDYGNGWFRIIATGTTDSSAGATKVFLRNLNRSIANDATYLGDATKGIYFYGLQLEKGAFATSYIPNHGTAAGVTRNFDTTDSVDFSDYMDGKDITFFVDLAKNPLLDRDSASTGIRFGRRNHNFSAFRFYRPGLNKRTAVYFADRDNDTLPASHQITTAGRVKVAVRRVESTGEFTLFYAGAQQYQASNTDFNDFVNLQIRADGQPIFINSILVFDRALTDDECKSLTTV